MIMSTDAEKAFGKIQNPFMIKMYSKLEVEGSNLDLIKNIYRKSKVNIILSGEKQMIFS